MEKRVKAQVSVEMLAIIGVIVLVSVIFATYYLSSVNRNIDQASSLEIDYSDYINTDDLNSAPPYYTAVCGNNILNAGEECDGSVFLNGTSCSSYDPQYIGGTVTCNPSGTSLGCTVNYSNCIDSGPQCGNDILESGEECDTTKFSSGTACANYDPANPIGTVTCNAKGTLKECTVDTSSCTSVSNPPSDCGNGVINNPPEQCDGSALPFGPNCTAYSSSYGGGTVSCYDAGTSRECMLNTSNCTRIPSTCGNGIINVGEDCDGSNMPITSCSVYDPVSYNFGSLSCFAPGTPNECTYNTTSCSYFILGETCGNNSLAPYPNEECELVNSVLVYNHADCNAYYSSTQGIGNMTGNLLCTTATCDYDLSSCVVASGAEFVLEVDQASFSNVPVSENRSVNTLISDFGDYNNIALSVYVLDSGSVPTNNCSYNGSSIPGNPNGLNITNLTPSASSISGAINCNAVGDYSFNFKGVQDSVTKIVSVSFNVISTTLPDLGVVSYTPNGGTKYNPITVTLTPPIAGADVYYTLNGSEPTTLTTKYTAPFVIASGYGSGQATTLKAKAYKTGYNPSPLLSVNYYFKVAEVATNPTPDYYPSPINLSLSTSTSGASIRYTLDGSTPDESSPLYTGPIPLSDLYTEVSAVGFKNNYGSSDSFYIYYYVTTSLNDLNVEVFDYGSGGNWYSLGDKLEASESFTVTIGNMGEVIATFVDPSIDGNWIDGGDPADTSYQQFNCNMFCQNHDANATCDYYSLSGARPGSEYMNWLIYNTNMHVSGVPTAGWTYPSGPIGTHVRFTSIDCDFSN